MISVIIPAYNSEKTITRALDSIVNQTYNGYIEIIIVNDGSIDETKNILENYQVNTSNIILRVINQSNGGVSTARNEGMKIANGQFIAFLDSDDAWKSNKIQMQMDIFQRLDEKIDFLATAFEEVYLNKRKDGELIKIEFKSLVFKNYFQPSTVIMRKRVFEEIGFFREDQKYAEEGNYFMRIAYRFNCYFLNSKLIQYGNDKSGFGESGLSANLKEMEKGELMNLKYIFENKMINYLTYIEAYSFSILKYIRRILIVKMR